MAERMAEAADVRATMRALFEKEGTIRSEV